MFYCWLFHRVRFSLYFVTLSLVHDNRVWIELSSSSGRIRKLLECDVMGHAGWWRLVHLMFALHLQLKDSALPPAALQRWQDTGRMWWQDRVMPWITNCLMWSLPVVFKLFSTFVCLRKPNLWLRNDYKVYTCCYSLDMKALMSNTHEAKKKKSNNTKLKIP